MPGYKSIRNYVYSFNDLIKTTTLKVKRPNEIHQMQERMDKAKVKFRQITGMNIDLLDSMLAIRPLEDVVQGESAPAESAPEESSPAEGSAPAPSSADEDKSTGK
jgi:hypothetical protein